MPRQRDDAVLEADVDAIRGNRLSERRLHLRWQDAPARRIDPYWPRNGSGRRRGYRPLLLADGVQRPIAIGLRIVPIRRARIDRMISKRALERGQGTVESEV